MDRISEPVASLSTSMDNMPSQLGERHPPSSMEYIHHRLLFSSPTLDGRTPFGNCHGSPAAHPPRNRPTSISLAPAYIHRRHPPTPTHHLPSNHSAQGLPVVANSGVPLLEDADGVLIRRAYECTFWFLSCTYIGYDKDEWKVNCLLQGLPIVAS